MSLRNWIVLLGLTTAGACGSVKSDDAPGDDGPPVEDTTPPKLMSSTPSDAANRVSVIGKIKLVFDEPLDPATVTPSAFVLTNLKYNYIYNFTTSSSFTTAYDAATHTVTLTVDQPMMYDARYSLAYGMGIKDEAGNAFAPSSMTFRTFVNNVTRRVSYNAANAVSNYQTNALDSGGHTSKTLYYTTTGIGADNTWFTADDTPYAVYQYTYTAAGELFQQRYLAAGPDAKMNTADDVISSMQVYEYDTQGHQIVRLNVNGAGPDTQWGTADDLLGSYNKVTWVNGNPMTDTYYQAPGSDNVWRTVDDVAGYIDQGTYDAAGNRTRYWEFEPGPDLVINTADDVVYGYSDATYDARGNVTEVRYVNTKGADNLWFTADDVTGGLQQYLRDAKGLDTGNRYINAPGTDMMWGTADDTVASFNGKSFDGNGLLTSQLYFSGPGVDAMWGTADDVLSQHYDTVYNVDGNKTDLKYFNGAGPDNIWRNSDDRIGNDSDFDLAN